jgi:hypothetical protein
MKPSRARLCIEALEDRITPSSVDIGHGSGVAVFNVAGYKLFQDNNNTFATTSSAFGFSEASMNAAQKVTTKNGGVVNSTLNDAFDGVLSFGLVTGGTRSQTTYIDADGIVDVTGATVSGTSPVTLDQTNPTVPVILTGDANTKGSDGNTFNGLELFQQNAVFAMTSTNPLDPANPTVPVIRSILAITNPTSAPITQELGDFQNLGSDSKTTIFTTSSGDATFSDAADRWVVTFQNYSGNTSTDPRILQVMQGPGTVASPYSAVWGGNGDDNPDWHYTVTVNPGETKYIMEFVALYPSNAQAAADGQAVFNSNATVQANGLLAGLTAQQLSETVNWDFTPPTVTSVGAPNVTNASNPSTYDFTVAYADNTAINVSTLGNSNVLVTGPNGYSQLASFVGVDVNSNGTPRTATYQLSSAQLPGGNGWDAADNGTYTLSLQANQVGDTSGNFAAAGAIGTFNVNVSGNVVVSGTPGDDTLVLSSGGPGKVTYVLNNNPPVTLTGVTSFTFDGLGGNDSMTVTFAAGEPAIPGGVVFDGGPGVNTLTLDAAGRPVRTVPGALTAGDPLTVNYANVQTINVNNAAAVNAAAGPDTADRATAFVGLTAQERFVQALYLDELGRAGSKFELDLWAPLLNAPGLNPQQARGLVAGGVAHSLEARDHLVRGWYVAFLGRQPVGGEEAGAVNLLLTGHSEEQVLSGILASPEFYARAQTLIPSGTADERYVQALYQLLLNRAGDAAGVAAGVAALPAAGRQGLALALLKSQEFRTDQFEGYYNAWLHRPDDPAGLINAVFVNLDVSGVRLAFESSPEFFTNG